MRRQHDCMSTRAGSGEMPVEFCEGPECGRRVNVPAEGDAETSFHYQDWETSTLGPNGRIHGVGGCPFR